MVREMKVDDDDYAWAKEFQWFYNCGYNHRNAYRPIHVKKGFRHRMPLLKEIILRNKLGDGFRPVFFKDGDRTNLQKRNLEISRMQRIAVARDKFTDRPYSSIYKGVCFKKKNGTWVAHVRANYRLKAVGSFATEEEAARAYDEAALIWYGPHAKLNFPRKS